MDVILNDIIYGKDPRQSIVNITYRAGAVDIYYERDGDVTVESELHVPYVLTMKKYPSSLLLKGNHPYRYKSPVVNSPYDSVYGRDIYKPRSIEEGYMLWSGTTLFKGMRPEDVSILGVDIETTSFNPNVENAKVLMISNTFRRKGEYVRRLFDLRTYLGNEEKMIADWCAWVREVNPSIITGHNIISFDMFYLHNRAQNNGLSLNIGRDGSDIHISNRISKFRKDATQQYEYNNITIHGRDIVDTLFLSIKYDQASRNFISYGLKNLEKQLDLVDDSRIEWDFMKNPPSEVYENGGALWEEFCDYCREDSDSPIKLVDLMMPPYFYLARSVPKTLQQIVNEGTGSYIDSFMVRSYLQLGFSQPASSARASYEGAISMGIPGMNTNVYKVDVASLYPSIMIQYDIYNKRKDPMNHMLKALGFFRDERLKNKELGAKGSKEHQDQSDAMKTFINSMYGFLGANYVLYNFPEGASLVTKHGREILLKGVEYATGHTLSHEVKKITNKGKKNEQIKYHWVVGPKVNDNHKGCRLVNTDTDSFAFSFPNNKEMNKAEFKAFVNELNSIYPEYIKWEDDGAYSRFMVVAAKNYVLQKHPLWCKPKDLDARGVPKITYKGSSIVDPKKEKALSTMLKSMIDVIFDGHDPKDTVSIYNEYIKKAQNIVDINEWSTKKTVTSSVLTESTTSAAKALSACAEALKKSLIKNIQEGDKFWVYQAIDGEIQKVVKGEPQFYKRTGLPMMVPNTQLRFPELWNGKDHYVKHYLDRVRDTAVILKNIVDETMFIDYNLSKNQKLLSRKEVCLELI